MKKITILIIVLLISITGFSQKRRDVRNDLALKLKVKSFYQEMYIQNSTMSTFTLPYCQQGSGTNYVLTGNIAPNYYVFPKNWGLALVLTPQIRVRGEMGKSYPLQPASFVPHGTFYLKLSPDTVNYKYLSLQIAHHSNGQDGDPLTSDGSINTVDGNFNTNYAELALNFGHQTNRSHQYVKLGVELHSGLLEILDEEAYRDQFGKIRFNYIFSDSKYTSLLIKRTRRTQTAQSTQELWRTVLEGMVIADSDYLGYPLTNVEWYQRFNVELKIYRKIKNSHNTSIFVSAGYLGHDYYNIHFQEHYPIFRIGLAAGSFFFKDYK